MDTLTVRLAESEDGKKLTFEPSKKEAEEPVAVGAATETVA
jgi:hypothetical protein